ncbi:MAG TPA: hypothetical protein VN285_12815 [Candidatus Deferrimicrobium sp.]|nr:hypothetical protein [Candidatus Deferrimicrobium sp.]
MKGEKHNPEYESEPELHRIFDMMLERFDSNPNRDLTPQIENVDEFLILHRLQGSSLWLQYYELEPRELMRFVLADSEKASGLDPLKTDPTPEEVTSTFERMLLALKDKSNVKEDLISDNIKLRAVQLLLANRCLAVSYVCLLQYKEPIASIIVQAMNGDEDAFLDLVKLDSAFLYSPYGTKFVLEAELRNDFKFKYDLANELDPDPKFWSLEGKRNHYIFLTLANLGD